MTEITEELLTRFFNRECTAAEAKEVVDYLKKNPAVLEKYLAAAEWDETKSEEMPEEFWNGVWQQIKPGTKSAAKIKWIKRAAAAAAIIMALGGGYNYFIKEEKREVIAKTEEKSQHLINTMNSTKDIMHIDLPDGSVVLLSPGSVVNYNMPFDDDKRDVELEGEGRFTVKKDQTRPFTVYAGNLATTALGTEFTINTKATGNKTVSIKLHTGKVVIKQTGSTAKAWQQDIYLVPGEQLEYDLASFTASVSKTRNEKPAVSVKPKPAKKNTAVPDTNELIFTSSPLTEVIIKLEKYFNTDISFDSTEISKMNFTGTISKTDSLPVVLKAIAQMNGLELTYENDGYRLSK